MSFLAALPGLLSGLIPAIPGVISSIGDVVKKFTEPRGEDKEEHPVQRIAKRAVEISDDYQECKSIKKQNERLMDENEKLLDRQMRMMQRQNVRRTTTLPKKRVVRRKI